MILRTAAVLILTLLIQAPTFAAEPIKKEKLFGLAIEGPVLFIQKTKEALNLLHSRRSLDLIQKYVGVIRASERSGIRAELNPPVYEVGKPTWNHSAIWYAGTIAHDAYHSKLYSDAKAGGVGEPPRDAWTGTEAERKCLYYQIEVLKKIGADARTIQYVQELSKNPTYQGDPNSYSDYQKRNW